MTDAKNPTEATSPCGVLLSLLDARIAECERAESTHWWTEGDDDSPDIAGMVLTGYPAALRVARLLAAALEKTRTRWEHAGEALEAFAGDVAREECDDEVAEIDAALAAAAREIGAEDAKQCCQSCKKNQATALHSCPYQADVNNDDATRCNCCQDCEYECLMSI